MADNSSKKNCHITKFVETWNERIRYYTTLAVYVESICKEEIKRNNIACRFDMRAKPLDSIELAIYKRQKKRQKIMGKKEGKLKSKKQILDAMHDLAGVRIRLYFPSDADKVQKIIQTIFDPRKGKVRGDEDQNVNEDWDHNNNINRFTGVQGNREDEQEEVEIEGDKGFETDDEEEEEEKQEEKDDDIDNDRDKTDDDVDEWPLQYKARHFRCKLKKDEREAFKATLPDKEKYRDYRFEIQVASSIMYSWADVYHDVIYKPRYGKTTKDEMTFLQVVSGLAHTGELALKQLQNSMLLREATEHTPFGTKGGIGSWLEYSLDGKISNPELTVLLIDIPTGVNAPAQLRNFIRRREEDLSESEKRWKGHASDKALKDASLFPKAPVAVNLLWLILCSKDPRTVNATTPCRRSLLAMAAYEVCLALEKIIDIKDFDIFADSSEWDKYTSQSRLGDLQIELELLKEWKYKTGVNNKEEVKNLKTDSRLFLALQLVYHGIIYVGSLCTKENPSPNDTMLDSYRRLCFKLKLDYGWYARSARDWNEIWAKIKDENLVNSELAAYLRD